MKQEYIRHAYYTLAHASRVLGELGYDVSAVEALMAQCRPYPLRLPHLDVMSRIE